MNKTIVNYEQLANILLDKVCNHEGIFETVGFLFDIGYTREELLELGFDNDTIWQIIKD